MGTEQSWILLILMALMLGIQHGFDLDHLATIDSMTRTVSDNPYLSRRVGFLFSLGHGLIVILISLIIGSGLVQPYVPDWLNGVGNWISIIFLLIFGLANLFNISQLRHDAIVPGRLIYLGLGAMLNKKSGPFAVMMVGALFAFSFDTFSQVSLFSISANLVSGCLFAITLGVVFMLGMMLTDGFNGLFVSSFISRVDKRSVFISRLTGLLIALFSLGIAVMNLIKIIHSHA